MYLDFDLSSPSTLSCIQGGWAYDGEDQRDLRLRLSIIWMLVKWGECIRDAIEES